MLDKYLQMIQNAFDSLTNLGGSDATWLDYFITVGYELAVLFVGLIYLSIIILIIMLPICICRKIWKRSHTNTAWHKHGADVHEYRLFVNITKSKDTTDFHRMECTATTKACILIVCFLILYAIFVIPFILLFF